MKIRAHSIQNECGMKNLYRKYFLKKKLLFYLGIVPVLLIALSFLFIEIGIYFFPFDIQALENRLADQSSVFFDKEDRIIWAHVSNDQSWRMPISLNEASEYFVDAIINTEDKRFWNHCGIDMIAGMRATQQLIKNRKIISGASTITMQLVRLAQPESRSLVSKVKQSLRALHLERMRSKEWILNSYINVLPFGKNIEGIEAASLYYFGKESRSLTLYETTMLAAIPQNPNKLRPDKYPHRCLKRQRLITHQMLDANIAPAKTNPNLFTPYIRHIYFPKYEKFLDSFPNFVSIPECLSLTPNDIGYKTITPFDAEIYRKIKKALHRQNSSGPSGKNQWNTSAVIIDNQTGNVLCEYGDFDPNRSFGYINAARSQRSPGSALKPWIYLLAIRKGIIIENTKLSDHWDGQTPNQDTQNYRPNNYDHKERSWVSASSALNQSLNIPAVKLLSLVNVDSFANLLFDHGVLKERIDTFNYGLSLALGSKEVSLIDLTKGYHRIFVESQKETSPLVSDSAKMLLSCLAGRGFPGAYDKSVAWKTGTSNGHKDAWCFAVTSHHTIGVWAGFKSRKSDSNLTGYHAAQPIASSILNLLESDNISFVSNDHFPWNASLTKKEWVCMETFRRATRSCSNRTQQPACRGVTLAQCRLHSRNQWAFLKSSATQDQYQKLEIASPENTHYITFDKQETLSFSLKKNNLNRSLQDHWFLNGAFLGSSKNGKALYQDLPPGQYSVSCVNDAGVISNSVKFTIRAGIKR